MNGENYLIILVWQALYRIAFIKLVRSGEWKELEISDVENERNANKRRDA
jgi:hypothetical protein